MYDVCKSVFTLLLLEIHMSMVNSWHSYIGTFLCKCVMYLRVQYGSRVLAGQIGASNRGASPILYCQLHVLAQTLLIHKREIACVLLDINNSILDKVLTAGSFTSLITSSKQTTKANRHPVG